jgi:hypothetical protein
MRKLGPVTEEEHSTAGRPAKYPWASWLVPNERVQLFRGEDFEVSCDSLRPQIHNQAKKRGGTVSTSLGTVGKRDYIDVTYSGPPVADESDFEFEKQSKA